MRKRKKKTKVFFAAVVQPALGDLPPWLRLKAADTHSATCVSDRQNRQLPQTARGGCQWGIMPSSAAFFPVSTPQAS